MNEYTSSAIITPGDFHNTQMAQHNVATSRWDGLHAPGQGNGNVIFSWPMAHSANFTYSTEIT